MAPACTVWPWRKGARIPRPVVTVTTGRGILAPFRQGQTVHAGAIVLGLGYVALLAIGRLGRDVVVGMLRRDVGVAARTGIGLVDRGRKLGHIDEQRDLFAGGISLGERFVRVAVKAGAVLDLFRGGDSRKRPD